MLPCQKPAAITKLVGNSCPVLCMYVRYEGMQQEIVTYHNNPRPGTCIEDLPVTINHDLHNGAGSPEDCPARHVSCKSPRIADLQSTRDHFRRHQCCQHVHNEVQHASSWLQPLLVLRQMLGRHYWHAVRVMRSLR